ncbi:alpha-ketoacid dehydrogenase subunit beta [Streptomyces sp. G44]|uniref:alpha-ketoacid dehydrogenase subunit beta n=1 Tax=Streptomyces sp. G44 TaxID=2807632 RepID=UPI001960A2AD|nr:transketolase C-terminal domain-containing protein [Streptomyces sp. G44]MBM7168899.1 alpha-ketoacid dehydrogenase subunit beta [Streptomyces sp. G44]
MSTSTEPMSAETPYAVPMSVQSSIDVVLREQLLRDPKAILMGCHPLEDWVDEFGPHRVRTCAISEPAMVGMAVGAAVRGWHPIVDLVRSSFAFVAADQIINQAAKLRYISGGQYRLQLTLRASTRTELGLAAQHEQTPFGVFMQSPGLKVVVPGTTDDSGALLRASFDDPNPVIFFESPQLAPGPADADPVGDDPAIGTARRLRAGTQVTVVGIGAGVTMALGALDRLTAEGIDAEVIDLRSLVPLDADAVRESVRRTGRLLVVEEGPAGSAAAAEVIARVCADQETFCRLRAPAARVTAAAVPIPFNPGLERAALPDTDAVLAAVRGLLG